MSQLEIGEILEPLYQTLGRVGEARRVLEAQLAHITEDPPRGSPCTTASPSSTRRSSSRPTARWQSTCAPSRSTPPTSARSRRPSARGVTDGGWERSPTRTPTCSAARRQGSPAPIGKRLARVFEEELGDVPTRRGDLQLRARRRAARRRALAKLDRIYTSLEQWAELARCSSSGASDHRASSSSSSTPPRRGLRGAAPRSQLDRRDARALPPIFDELDRTHEQAILALERIYAQGGQWPELKGSTSASSSTPGATAKRPTSGPRWRTSSPTGWATCRAIDTWKRVLDLRGDDPEALAASRTSTSAVRSGPSSATCSSGTSTSRRRRRARRRAAPRRAPLRRRASCERRLALDGLPARPRHRLRNVGRALRAISRHLASS
jgi:hypothetical protein